MFKFGAGRRASLPIRGYVPRELTLKGDLRQQCPNFESGVTGHSPDIDARTQIGRRPLLPAGLTDSVLSSAHVERVLGVQMHMRTPHRVGRNGT